jgi:hypothetical protein
MMTSRKIRFLMAGTIVMSCFLTLQAQDYMFDMDDLDDGQPDPTYSPFADEHFPKKVLWGDTHLHTSNSFDAGFMNFRVGPEEAFRFARGEEVMSNSGMRVKLVRPLDFLVVADHAEYLGLTPALRESNPVVLEEEAGRRWNKALLSGEFEQIYAAAMEAIQSTQTGEELIKSEDFKRSMWNDFIKISDEYNNPGVFTAFSGFEWTSSAERGNNIHRVVIFADEADRLSRTLPFSLFDSEDPEDLWNYMSKYESKTGGNVLAIAHNGNLSNGYMFATKTLLGEPITKQYAKRRMKWEPLYEVTQIKGDGETHPFLSPNDEFADYGTWDRANIVGTEAKTEDMLQNEYARSALKLGLKLGNELGINPFKFGMVGSTDSHTGLATAKEENFFGKASHLEPDNQERAEDKIIQSPLGDELTSWGWEQVAGGLAAVWATENTREAIFEAMERKETYATTGSRMKVRFFGGWDFSQADIEAPRPVKEGYARGVPMGGDLRKAPLGKSPIFLVWALRDPDGANLDRIQIIKGWVDETGKTHERVFDVAVSGDRNIDGNGRCRKIVGNTVDLEEASYTNSIGAPLLATAWEDPDFDPTQRAFYYVRVIEIPTPKWTAYDAKSFGIDLPNGDKGFHQERAYTSPIWYTP